MRNSISFGSLRAQIFVQMLRLLGQIFANTRFLSNQEVDFPIATFAFRLNHAASSARNPVI